MAVGDQKGLNPHSAACNQTSRVPPGYRIASVAPCRKWLKGDTGNLNGDSFTKMNSCDVIWQDTIDRNLPRALEGNRVKCKTTK